MNSAEQDWMKDLLFHGDLKRLQYEHPDRGYVKMVGYDRVLWIREAHVGRSPEYRLIVGSIEQPRIDNPAVLREDGLVKLVNPLPVPHTGKVFPGTEIEIYACIPVEIDIHKRKTLEQIWQQT